MVTTILSKLVKGNQKGSSALMELIIVMIFVAALIAFVVPTYYQYINKAKLTLAHSTLESINDDLISYKEDYRRYPIKINFETGKDESGNIIFRGTPIDQISTDLSSINSYVGTADTYTLIAIATDKKLTVMTLTPTRVSY